MQIPGLKQNALSMYARFIAIVFFAFFTNSLIAQSTTTATTINITDSAKLTTAKRIGLVLGNQDFYDSGQFMRNITFRNPGFEAEIWQSILHCEYVTATTCTDDDLYTYWPANFLANAKAEFIVGAATGETTTVTKSTAAVIGTTGVQITFPAMAKPPAVGDYVVVRMSVPGNAEAGWWVQGTSGTKFTTETSDLSPNTPGKQALRVTQGTSDIASVASYMDSVSGHSFLQLNGSYTLKFRAKGTGGSNQVIIGFERAVSAPPAAEYFNQTVTLTNSWQDYSYTFSAKDIGQIGTLSLKFTLVGSSMIIDDVALTAAAAADNPTVYRDEVVTALKALKPGILRFMDSGTDWGSTIDNMLQPDFVRERAGYTNRNSEMDDIPLNLHDYLVLCQTIGAEPWYTMPTGMSTTEMSNLMDYFGGSTSTVYGARRAALGQTAPWTTVFPKIHLEFGNEVWNVSNPGASMNDALSYGKRAGVIFTTAKNSASYNAKVFDLIQDGMEANPYWTQQGLSTSTNYDTVDSTAYIFSNLNDTSSTEAIYGSMFAEPESLDSTTNGQMTQMAAVAAGANPPAKLSVYEMNMGTNSGSASQAFVNSSVASAGAGIAVADNMLLLMRDLGITDQNMFALQGLDAPFNGTTSTSATTAPIWGIVIDMGGATNLKRPMYLTQMMANNAILPTLLSTSQTGNNPTWNQAYTTNDNFSLTGAHYIQSFAFTDGTTMNIILFNLSRTTSLPVNFAGLNTPLGAATINTLYSPSISATNDAASNVIIKSSTATLTASSSVTLAPYSMTVISVAKPVVPIVITSMTASCARTSLSPSGTTDCTAAVIGQGKYNAGVNWTVDAGTISSDGVYVAPATIPASGKATITATSEQDATKKVTIPVSIANDAVTGVTATCAATSVGEGQSLVCKATVNGTGGFSSAYTWSTTAGSILANGTVTAPTSGTTMTVKATSTQDPTKSGSVTLSVTPVLIMTTAPKSISTTSTTATIAWATNLAAHGGISYGPTQSLGLSTPYVATASTNQSFTLTGLKPGTTYYMAVYSFMNGQTVTQPFNTTTATGTSAVTGISVSCPTTTGLVLGGTLGCTAKVTGTGSYSGAVTWSTSAGSITTAGLLTAPLTGTSLTVKATSVQDTAKSASVTISLTQPTITAVSLSCGSTSVSAGAKITCTPTVTGTGSFSSAVTWTTSAGSITSAGVLTAPTTGTSVTVKATSTADKTKSASATLTVTPVSTIAAVSLTCAASSVKAGATVSCTPKVTGTGGFSSAVTWTTSAGSITSAGVLTAPTTGTSTTVKATSTQDPTKSASLTLTVTPVSTITAVSITCAASSVKAGATVDCTPKVKGTGSFSSAVTWTTSAGTITPAGVLTAPATGTSVTVKATSTQDTTKSASATIAVTSVSTITGVTVTCGATAIPTGGATSCSAVVAGTGSYASTVSWAASAGTITSSGVLTAPMTGTSVKVTATSLQDTTKSGSVVITLSPALIISNPVISTTSSTITASWTLNSGAHSAISYGPTSKLGSGTPYDATVTTTPKYTLTGLKPSTTYTLVIYSFINGQTVSKTLTATTGAAPTITGVTVSCNATTVVVKGTSTCAAKVTGTSSFSSAVTWSTTGGTITSAGVLTAPATGSAVTVTATSTEDKTKLGTAVITLNPVIVISSPVTTTTASSITVSWSLNFASHNGVSYGPTTALGSTTPYVATATTKPSFTLTGLKAATTYHLVIYSFQNGQNVSEPLTVTTAAATSAVSKVSVTCGSTSVVVGGSVACSAKVTGTGDYSSAVTWATTAGTITSKGELTASSTEGPMTIRATSVQDKAVSGDVTIAAVEKLAIVKPAFSVTSTTIVLSWKVTEGAHNGVDYGLTASYGKTTPYESNLTAAPTYTFTGLKPGTEYHFLLFSFNSNGSVTTPITIKTAVK